MAAIEQINGCYLPACAVVRDAESAPRFRDIGVEAIADDLPVPDNLGPTVAANLMCLNYLSAAESSRTNRDTAAAFGVSLTSAETFLCDKYALAAVP